MKSHGIIETFSCNWWISIVLTICVIILIIWFARNFSDETKKQLATGMGILFIANAIFIHLYQLWIGEWELRSSLPLNLCSLSGILSGLVLLYPKQFSYEYLLYWGVPGAFHSYLTPEMTLGSDGWYFYDYYLMHGGIFLSAIYLSVILQFAPRVSSWLRVWLGSQVLILLVFLVDKQIDANYMYLIAKPAADNPLIIGEWPWYLIGFEIAALVHAYLTYLLFRRNQQ